MRDVDPHLDPVDCDRRLDDLDRLTELWRQQADMCSARVEIVEGRAAAVATAAAALGTLIVSQAEALSVANTRATIAFWLLTAAAGLSFFARVLPRGHWIAAAKELLSSTQGAKEKGRWSRALRQGRTFSLAPAQLARIDRAAKARLMRLRGLARSRGALVARSRCPEPHPPCCLGSSSGHQVVRGLVAG